MEKLNLGCGFYLKKWYVNADIVYWDWVDKVFNFEVFPYPFPDNHFDEIYAGCVLEHIHDLVWCMKELIRISKDWCKIQIVVPYFTSPSFRWDPTHVRNFCTLSFGTFHKNSFLEKNSLIKKKYRIHFLSNPKFMKDNRWNIIPDFFINLMPRIYERFFCYMFPAADIHFLLEVKKS